MRQSGGRGRQDGGSRSGGGRNGDNRSDGNRSDRGRNSGSRSDGGRSSDRNGGKSGYGNRETGYAGNREGRSENRSHRGADRSAETTGGSRKQGDFARKPGQLPKQGRIKGESAQLLKPGRIKGEWMEIRLPDAVAGAPLPRILPMLPLAPKQISKLSQARGLLLQGNTLRLHLFPRESRDFPPDWMDLNILYEDEYTLVINKPSGIEVHPSEKGQRRTLAHAVSAYYEMSGQDLRIRHIHRIDKETTGPVLYAKNEFAHYQYDKAMREKAIERVYVALAEGVLAQNKGTINQPIGQDRHHPTRRRVSETGESAVTHFEVVERFPEHTLVRLRLETGRTHQIRVHLSAIGHPLAGDGLYGGKRTVMSRQALHGERLIWNHPWTGEKQHVQAPLPEDFAEALKRLRAGRER